VIDESARTKRKIMAATDEIIFIINAIHNIYSSILARPPTSSLLPQFPYSSGAGGVHRSSRALVIAGRFLSGMAGRRDRVMAYLDLMAKEAEGADHPLQLPYRAEGKGYAYVHGGRWGDDPPIGLSDQHPPKDPSRGPSLCTHLHIDVQLLTMTLLRG